MTLREVVHAMMLPRFSSASALARAARISPSLLSLLLTGERSHASTSVCLRLSSASGVPVDVVLRAAGNGYDAQLLEHLYGRPLDPPPATLTTPPPIKELTLLKRLRAERGWSYSQLSREMRHAGCPVSPRTLNYLEQHNHAPYPRTLRRIALFLAHVEVARLTTANGGSDV